MSEASARPDVRIASTYVRCSGSSGESARRSAMPSTPLSGVRISWLMVARKRLLAWLAASAFATAPAALSSSAILA